MGILPKSELIRRIMVGEVLINSNADTKIDAETKKLILKCFLSQSTTKVEKYFKTYFDDMSLDDTKRNKRKNLIKTYVENFVEVKISQSEKKIKNDFRSFGEGFDKINEISPPIFIDSLNTGNLKAANLDLTLGNEVYVTTDKVPQKLNTMGKDGVVSIEPGEFGILMTHEYLFVPWDLMGYISIRLTHKQKGLVNISGFHVDPGYYGRLLFAIFNAGPNNVPLRYNEAVFMIMFNELLPPPKEGLAVKKGSWYGMENIPVETLSGLTGKSLSVRNLDERLKKLEMIYPALGAGIASIVIAVITWILTHW